MTSGKLMKWIKKKLGIVSLSDYWPMISKKVNEDFWEGWNEGLQWIKENERARRANDDHTD